MISQGGVYWLPLAEPKGSEPGYHRPVVVIQNDALNRSRIATTIVCALTTNVRWAAAPGNVLLNKGEANLPKTSVANVSQVMTVDKSALIGMVGQLPKGRIGEILSGLDTIIRPMGI